ncbi:response regulator [Abyssalbus ytuae]|uniref:Response regulator transcription factor n=1 Tax=Abyssalbus ytuae TaxID=2926907 RepID=A0A9E6ZX83_9FLAO|nr:response regulator transcription factor [Abyssalbus ytuae]UOB18511.1 response regulator transcription factor [Abyssalbus ytuae]
MKTYNLIIADDHKMFLDGLISILQEDKRYNILFTAKNGNNIIKYLEINSDTNVDMVITDISMPEMDGITLNKMIKEKFPAVKTLILSMHNDGDRIQKVIENDADGYILKNAEKSELLKAVETIFSGEKFFSESVKSAYMNKIISNKKEEQIKLTEREIDVIKLIAQEHTTQEIAEKLFLSKHTVESYRKTLIAKLNVRNLAGLTKYALKMGYIKN